ncbi:MAG TPA: hypothetical protein VIM11_23765 [Tepidisphaeraceae bacterium]
MESSDKLRDAAIALGVELQDIPSVTGVGVTQKDGDAALVVYVSRKLRRSESTRVPSHWDELPVFISLLGKVIPAAS